jgi:hypothetical protein
MSAKKLDNENYYTTGKASMHSTSIQGYLNKGCDKLRMLLTIIFKEHSFSIYTRYRTTLNQNGNMYSLEYTKLQVFSLCHIHGDDVSMVSKEITDATMISKVIIVSKVIIATIRSKDITANNAMKDAIHRQTRTNP